MRCAEGNRFHDEFKRTVLARIEAEQNAKPAPVVVFLKAKEVADRKLLADHIRDCPQCWNSTLFPPARHKGRGQIISREPGRSRVHDVVPCALVRAKVMGFYRVRYGDPGGRGLRQYQRGFRE
jgi:hypothetical protein